MKYIWVSGGALWSAAFFIIKLGICLELIFKKKLCNIGKQGLTFSRLVCYNNLARRGIAQLVEYRTPNPLVEGSIPSAPAKFFSWEWRFAHLFERWWINAYLRY